MPCSQGYVIHIIDNHCPGLAVVWRNRIDLIRIKLATDKLATTQLATDKPATAQLATDKLTPHHPATDRSATDLIQACSASPCYRLDPYQFVVAGRLLEEVYSGHLHTVTPRETPQLYALQAGPADSGLLEM